MYAKVTPLIFVWIAATCFPTVRAQTYCENSFSAGDVVTAVQAIAYLGQLVSSNRADNHQRGEYFFQLANEAFRRGEYREAIENYREARRAYRNDNSKRAQVIYQLGLCHYILGEYSEAVSQFNQTISLRPRIPDAYYFRGKIEKLVFGRNLHAQRDFQRVVELSSPSTQKAFAFYFLGNFAKAEQMMLDLLERVGLNSSEEANIQYNIAGLYALEGRKEAAVEYLGYAFQNGFDEIAWFERDINFDRIRFTRVFLRWQDGLRSAPPVRSNDRPLARRDDSPNAPAYLLIRDLKFRDEDGTNAIDPAETCYLEFVLRNEGRGQARGLELILSEETNAVDVGYPTRRTLGDLRSGEEVFVRVEIAGGNQMQDGTAEFRFYVREENGFDSRASVLAVPMRTFSPPQLALVDHHFTTTTGGRMQLGMPINLKMAVQNLGQGTARDVKLSVSVPDNVFSAGKSEFVLGELTGGESEIIDFEFFTNRRYQGQSVPIAVRVTDGSGMYVQEQTFSVELNQILEQDARVVIRPNGPSRTPSPITEVQLRSDVDRDLPRTNNRNDDAIAVVIGNRDYENTDVPPVDFALQDAYSMKRYLVEVLGYREDNVVMLTNATQADFNGMFGTNESHEARLFNLVKPNISDVFVYYSGHGAPDIESQEGFFLPIDCDPSLVRFNGYSINTLYDNLGKIPYRSLTVVLDACFSGASDRGTLMPQTSLVRIPSRTSVLQDPAAVVLTASEGDQVASWYPEQYHGLFTYYFLKALQGDGDADRDRVLTLGELRTYLDEKVPYMARRLRNRQQTPEAYGRDDRVIVRY